MIAKWPIRYRNWLKRHKPNQVVADIDGYFDNPVSNFLTEKIGREISTSEEVIIIQYRNGDYAKDIAAVTGQIPENVSEYIWKLYEYYDGKKIQARTALRLLEEE